jgi:hypothetical protein
VIPLAACFAALAPLCSALQGPEPPAAAFEQAVAAYRAGDWATARTLWQGLLDEPSIDRASVLYDLGNVAWREGEPLAAAAYYTACIRLAPRHRDAWANLEFVRAEAGLEPADRGDLRSTARRLLFSLDRAESEWLALAAAASFASALGYEALRGSRSARRLVLAAGLFLLVGLAPWVAWLLRGEGRALFVVAAEGGALRSSPSGDAALIGRLEPASEALWIDALPGWVRARAGGMVGWVEESAVRAVDPPYGLAPISVAGS